MSDLRLHHDCPRCGYDLSGEIETWQEACPVLGVCSECGLGFGWGSVLHPAQRVPRWAVEHPMGLRVHRCASSFVRAFRPGPLWSAIRIEQPIRARALVLFVGLQLVLLHAGVGLSVAVRTFIELGRWGAPPVTARLWEAAHPLLWPYSSLPGGWYWGAGEAGVQCVALLMPAAAMPLAFLALGPTLAQSRVRRVHLVRAFALTLPIPILGCVAGVSIDPRFGLWSRAFEYASPLLGVGPPTWITWGALALFFWSWWLVVRRYLRLEQPGAVMLAMSTIALLSGLSAVVFANLAAW